MSTREPKSEQLSISAMPRPSISSLSSQSFSDEERFLRRLETAVFPISSELSRLPAESFLQHLIVILFEIIQLLGVTSLYSNETVWPTKSSFMRVVSFGCDLLASLVSFEAASWHFLGMGLLCLFMVGFIAYVIGEQYYTRNVKQWHLYVARFIFSVGLVVITPIVFALTGLALRECFETFSTVSIAISVIYLVLGCICMLVLYAGLHLTIQTATIPTDPFGCFDFRIRFRATMTLALMGLAENALIPFPTYVLVLALICAVVWNFTNIRLIYFLPYTHLVGDVFIGTAITFFSYASAFAIFLVLGVVQSATIMLIAFGVGAVAIGASLGYILSKRRKHLLKTMSYSAVTEGSITDQMKREHFETLVFTSVDDVVGYLRVALTGLSDTFIDFSFPHYLVENYQQKEVILEVARFVGLFPGETQFFSYILSILSNFRNLSILEHNLVYNLKSTLLFRQSSVNNEVVSEIEKLKKRANEATAYVRGLWMDVAERNLNINFGYLRFVSQVTSEVEIQLKEACAKYTTNAELADLYAIFLVECKGDYAEATKWYEKELLIQTNAFRSVDYSFRSLANAFPEYLYQGVVGLYGEALVGREEFIGQHAESSSSTVDEDFMNQKVENYTQRIRLQEALKSIKFPALNRLIVVNFIVLFLAAIFLIATVVLGPLAANSVGSAFDGGAASNYIGVGTQFMALYSTIALAEINGLFSGMTNLISLAHLSAADFAASNSLVNNGNLYMYLKSSNISTQFTDLLRFVFDNAGNYGDAISAIYAMNNSFVYKNNLFTNNIADITMHSTLSMLTYFIEQYIEDTGTSYPLYNVAKNSLDLYASISRISNNILTNSRSLFRKLKSSLQIFALVAPVLVGLLIIVISIVALKQFFDELSYLGKILSNTPKTKALESCKPLLIGSKSETINVASAPSKSNTHFMKILIAIGMIVFGFGVAALIYVGMLWAYNYANDSSNHQYWYAKLSNSLMDTLHSLAIIASYYGLSAGDADLANLGTYINSIGNYYSDVTTGSSSILGYNANIDKAHAYHVCSSLASVSEMYSCVSLSQSIAIAESYLQTIKAKMSGTPPANLDMVQFADAVSLVTIAFNANLDAFRETVATYHTGLYSGYIDSVVLLATLAIIVSIMIIIIFVVVIMSTRSIYDAFLQLFCLLPVSEIPSKIEEISSLIGTEELDTPIPSLGQALISTTDRAILILTPLEIIHTVNAEFTKITGFSTDQVLGLPISSFLPSLGSSSTTSNSRSDDGNGIQFFYEALYRMKNSKYNSSVETNILLKTTGDELVNCNAVVMDFHDTKGGLTEYAIVLHNLSREMNQMKQIKDTKRKTDRLIKELLPPEVNNLITEGAEEIVFNKEKATLIMIKLEGLRDQAIGLTPNQLLTSIGMIIHEFENLTRKHDTIHLLKANDDVIVACTGLFDSEAEFELQVSEALAFCTEAIDSMGFLNSKLDMDLHLKLSVNFHGPVIGTVLDLDNPSFNLFGSSVEFSKKMLTTPIVDEITVTEPVLAFIGEQYTYEPSTVFVNALQQRVKSFVVHHTPVQ